MPKISLIALAAMATSAVEAAEAPAAPYPALLRVGDGAFSTATQAAATPGTLGAKSNMAPRAGSDSPLVKYATNLRKVRLGTFLTAEAVETTKLTDVYKKVTNSAGKDVTGLLVQTTAMKATDEEGRNLAGFDVDLSKFAEGVYTFDSATTAAAVKVAGHKVEITVDRTAPVPMDASYTGTKAYIGNTVALDIPIAALFKDSVSTIVSVDTVLSKAIGSKNGLTISEDGTKLAGDVAGPPGNSLWSIVGKDEAGNTATAMLTVPIFAKIAPALSVYDARGAGMASTSSFFTGSAGSAKKLTVVATFPEAVKDINAADLVITGATPTTKEVVASAGSSSTGLYRTYTFNMAFATLPTGTFTIEIPADAGVSGAGVVTGASKTLTIKVDTAEPTAVGTVAEAPVAAVNAPYVWVIPTTALFTDDQTANKDIYLTEGVASAGIGLSFTAGNQGNAMISGTPTAAPVSTCTTSGKTGVQFTIKGRDLAGNTKTNVVCVPVVAPAAPATLAFARSTLAVKENEGTTGGVKVDAAAVYTGPAASKIVFQLVSSDAYGATDEMISIPALAGTTVGTYTQADSLVGKITVTPSTGTISAADVQKIIQSAAYVNTKAAPTTGTRTVRVFISDADAVQVASATRTIALTSVNSAPVLTKPDAATWTEGGGVVQAIQAATLTDADDAMIRSASVWISRTAGTTADSDAYVACDSDRDVLRLDPVSGLNMVGVWDAKGCALTIKSADGKSISKADMTRTLAKVVYDNKDDANPTNYGSADVNKLLTATVTDDASEGKVSVPATSTPVSWLLTVSPVDTAPKFDLEATYGENGLLYGTSKFAQTERFLDGKGNTITHRRFLLELDATSAEPLVSAMSFDLSKQADGVFGKNKALIDLDNKDRNAADAVTVECCDSLKCEASTCTEGVAIDGTPAFAEGKLAFNLKVTDQTLRTTQYMKLKYGSAEAVYGVELRRKKCVVAEDFDEKRDVPSRTACAEIDDELISTKVAPGSGTAASITPAIYTRLGAALDSAVKSQESSGASFASQIESLRPERLAARGTYSIGIPADSFSSVSNVTMSAKPAPSSVTNFIPAPRKGSADPYVAVQLGPAGQTFIKPVEVCVHVGDAGSGFQYQLQISSQLDSLDSSKGYSELTDMSDQTFDARTGRLCAKTTHFSVAVPVLVPIPAAPTQQKNFQMGASCPNDCSGKGLCRENGKCACFSGFQGYDCSLRTCAAAESWDTQDSVVHKPAECSNRGSCDTKSGTCACYKGFEGAACQRVSCPNDCSSNGKCRFLSELPLAQQAGYSSWETSRIQVCQCDGGYTGPDCSQRLCPYGDDPETVCRDSARQVQTITLDFGSLPASVNNMVPDSVYDSDELAFTFSTATGSNFTTFRVANAFEPATGTESLQKALKALPMFAVSDVAVSGTGSRTSPVTTWQVTFDGSSLDYFFSPSGSPTSAAGAVAGNTVAGNQALLQCPTIPGTDFVTGCSGAACRPQFKQLRILESPADSSVKINPNAILQQPAALDAASTTSKWGVVVNVVVTNTNGVLSYEATSQVFESATAGASVAKTVFPPAGLRTAVPLVYGLAVDFSDSVSAGSYTFKWHLPTCKVAQTTASDPDFESLQCSRRGACDRKTGECACFNGYTGFSCSQQTVIV